MSKLEQLNFKIKNDLPLEPDDILDVYHEETGNVWITDSETIQQIRGLKDGNGFHLVTLGKPPYYGLLLLARPVIIVKEKCLMFGIL